MVHKDGKITLAEFQSFVGRMGGVQKMFEHRRKRVAISRKDICPTNGVHAGARVRAHFFVNGDKSRSWREAQVLGVNVKDGEAAVISLLAARARETQQL